MSLIERKYLYKEVTANGNIELDYLDTPLENMELSTTQTFRIPYTMEYRPDLISQRFFGNFDMGWLIAMHNGFLDPVFEFTTGRLINIPDLEEYYRFYNANSRSRR